MRKLPPIAREGGAGGIGFFGTGGNGPEYGPRLPSPKEDQGQEKKVKVKFTFSSSVAGASFMCKLDKGAFAKCTSPKSYKVKPGKHKFSVETVSAGGADPSPATFSFSVKKKD